MLNHLSTVLSNAAMVGVEFTKGGKVYHYKTNHTHVVGDTVVVMVQGTLKFVTVVEVDSVADLSATYDYKWVVGIVDLKAYATLVDAERKFKQGIQKSIRANTLATVQKAMAEKLSEATGGNSAAIYNEYVKAVNSTLERGL